MTKRQEYLSKHPYAIWEGSDGFWRTYLPDENKTKGRVLKKKKSKDDLENDVVDYWRTKEENPTVDEVFEEYVNRRLELNKISGSTHYRYIQNYKRHYSNGMGRRRIKSIDPEDWEEFLEREIATKHLSARAFANLKTITKGLLKRAKKRKLISFNVTELFQELDVSDSTFSRKIKTDEQEVFSEEDFIKVVQHIMNKPDLINLGILLMFVSGVRVGELVTLKWEDVEGNSLFIRRTESRVKSKNGKGYDYIVKEYPKTEAGIRRAIIPNGYMWAIRKIRNQNPFGDFLFMSKGKRVHTNTVRTRMRTMCDKLGIYRKSPHKARKTYASILLDSNIDHKLILEIMGHTNILTTESHYHRNRRSMERKVEIVSGIPEFAEPKIV